MTNDAKRADFIHAINDLSEWFLLNGSIDDTLAWWRCFTHDLEWYEIADVFGVSLPDDRAMAESITHLIPACKLDRLTTLLGLANYEDF